MKHFFIPNPKLSDSEIQDAIEERFIKIENIITCLYASCDACVPVSRNTLHDTLCIAYDLLLEVNLLRAQKLR